MIRKIIFIINVLMAISIELYSEDISLSSKITITVLEMDKGDKLTFTMASGRKVNFELVDTDIDILFTSLDSLKKAKAGEATIYTMTCKVRIDGKIMEMVRYVPAQETYYKPYVVNGLNIWFDAVNSLTEYFNENHGACVPEKDARFAFQDAGKQICPQELSNWWPEPANQIYIKDGYMGEDSWLGPYFAANLHGGTDVNMPSNTPMIAPIDFDEHYYFNSVESGHNNNRWRGIRNWENGDIWYLQTHHVNKLLIPQNRSIKQGEVYAHGAGTWSWYSPHAHFVFETYQPEFDSWTLMDPWVIIWQIFENNRRKANEIIANIEPLEPASTGEKVHFYSKGSKPSIYGGNFEFFWDFGDGYTSFEENPVHVFHEAGIYPVTLTVRNGTCKDSYTQHITISGETKDVTLYKITCENEPSYRVRPAWKTSAYGSKADIVNTLVFKSYQTPEGKPEIKTVSIWFNKTNSGENKYYPDDISTRPEAILPIYVHGDDWLEIEKISREDHVDLKIKPVLENVLTQWGFYEAYIMINQPDAINNPQYIRVLLDINYDQPKSEFIVDNKDEECIKSGYYWLSPPQHSSISAGYKGDYCISGGSRKGEFIRYTPNLKEGSYEVSLYGKVYDNPKVMEDAGSFDVIVHHAGGMDKIRVNPAKSLDLGTYDFTDGRNGYVEIVSDEADGMIVADAVKFDKK